VYEKKHATIKKEKQRKEVPNMKRKRFQCRNFLTEWEKVKFVLSKGLEF